MTTTNPPAARKWLFIPPILLGIGIVAVLKCNTRQPARLPPQEAARVLRTITAPRVDVVPRVLGYGTAAPAQVWRAVAEVGGRAVEVHAELKPGAFLKAGERVLKIDPNEYELAVSQLEAEIAEIEARVGELATQEENDQASLKIEEASLRLAESDLARVRDLIERDVAASTEVRDEERTYLAQKQKAQILRNALNLVPRQQSAFQASLAVKKARLERARLDLAKTVIHTPFDCRLGEVLIEKGQFLKTNEVLFEADGVATAEVDAQVAMDRARNLLRAGSGQPLGGIPDMAELREVFNVDATVRMRIGLMSAEWQARFVRVRERIDPVTHTVAVVVAVDEPYAQAIPGQRPPLVRGSFCEVELRGKALPDRIVIPRAALREGHVYVVDANNRLERRPVSVLFKQSDFVSLDSGLDANERIVVSDPTPAIDGMLVEPVPDDELRASMIAQATGSASVR